MLSQGTLIRKDRIPAFPLDGLLPLNGFRGPETRMDASLWDWGIVLYRHFYRRKPSAFAGAGDGLGLRGGYSGASIVNYRQASEQQSPRCAASDFNREQNCGW